MIEELNVVIDPRMESIIEQMFRRCYTDGCFKQAVGIALDTRRIDKLEEACREAIAANKENILGYTYNLCQGARNVPSRDFRLEVVDVLVRLYGTMQNPDYKNVCFSLQSLNRPYEVAQTLLRLCKGSESSSLQAFQIAFDLQEAENQGFVLKVVSDLKKLHGPSNGSASDASQNGNLSIDMPGPAEGDEPSPAGSPVFLRRQESVVVSNDILESRLDKLNKILMEGFDVDLILNFLFKQNQTDTQILNDIKKATEGRTTVLHNATVVAHAYMNCGTTQDSFLRNNLDWLGKATNWAKYTAVASVGVVHKGHVHESMNLLQPYLPRAGQNGASPYSESGALYALGLIHANKGGSGDSTTINYLTDALRNAGNNEVVQHGATLGIGLAAMATGDEELFEHLKGVLYTDSAVAGEGAALAIGLVIPDLLNYAHDTTHEKIVRALALAIAMMVYGKEESLYAIGMAYCGTSDNGAIRKLLHVAVSDVSDDVRRAALLQTLIEDQTDYVRSGALQAMSLVLQQCAEARSPSVKKFRAHLAKTIGDKHQPVITKSGAILASGILDAGGRNCVVSMQSRAGFMKMGAAVGVMMWLQSWYWYPLFHMLSLSFAPTMLIGLNKDFNMPLDFILSTTARAKAREARKEARAKLGASGGMEAPPLQREAKPEEPKKKEKEPSTFEVTNPSRLTPSQRRFIGMTSGVEQRYQPVDKRSVPAGIVMLVDNDPTAPENVTIVERVALGQGEEEAEPPAPFDWNPADE
eukprot:GSChrysophyteH1.ASY1.ANO1.1049.1 assembled CDS